MSQLFAIEKQITYTIYGLQGHNPLLTLRYSSCTYEYAATFEFITLHFSPLVARVGSAVFKEMCKLFLKKNAAVYSKIL